jgi:hypothetical protein
MRRRQRRPGPACDGPGPGRGQRSGAGRGARSGGGGGSLGGRTATRALIAVGAYVVQDLRDTKGLTRPLLRRAALRLAVYPSKPVRRIGGAYLRLDPPEPGEVRQGGDVIDVHGAASASRALPAPPAPESPDTTGSARDDGRPR